MIWIQVEIIGENVLYVGVIKYSSEVLTKVL